MKNSDKKSSLCNRKLALESLESRELLAVGFFTVVPTEAMLGDPTDQIAFNVANAKNWVNDANDLAPANDGVITARLNYDPMAPYNPLDQSYEHDYTLSGSGNSFTLSDGTSSYTLNYTVVASGKDVWVISGLDPNKTHILTNYNNQIGEDKPSDITLGTVPAPPQNVIGSGRTNNSITVKWTADAPNLSYTVEYQIYGGNWSQTWTKSAGQGNSTVILEGLKSNTQYEFRVRAENSFGTSEWSLAPPAWTSPDQTHFIREEGYITTSSNSITLKWYEVPGCSYVIEYTCDDDWNNNATSPAYGFGNGQIWETEDNSNNQDADMPLQYYVDMLGLKQGDNGGGYWGYFPDRAAMGTGSIEKTVGVGVTQTEISLAIKDNALYSFRIIAIGNGGYSSSFDQIEVHAAPQAPTNFVLSARTKASITLTSTQPIAFKTNGNPYWGTGSATIQNRPTEYRKVGDSQWISNGNSATFTGLAANTQYEFRIKAVNNGTVGGVSYGGGMSSVWTYYQTSTLLEEPKTFRSTAQSYNSITMEWAAQTGVDKFNLQYRKAGDSVWNNYNGSLSGADTSATIIALESNTQYEFRIQAENAVAPSGWITSAANTATIKATNFLAKSATITSLTLKWDSLRDVNYKLEYKKASESTWQFLKDAGGVNDLVIAGTGSVIDDTAIVNLNSNTSYNFRLTASYAMSSEQTLMTASTESLKARNLTATTTLDTATVKWDFLAVGVTYKLEYKLASNSNWTNKTDIDKGTSTGVVIEGLEPNKTYDFRVTASHSSGTPEINTITVATKSLTPIIVSLTATANNATLTWESQVLWGIDGYKLQYRKTSEDKWTTYSDYGGILTKESSDATVTGLSSDTEYEFRLTAKKGAKEEYITKSIKTDTLIVLNSLTAETVGDGTEITVKWQVTGEDTEDLADDAKPTGFTLEYKLSTANVWTTYTLTLPVDAREATVTGLTVDKLYNFRLTVYGINATEEVYTVDTRTFLPAPKDFKITERTTSTARLEWTNTSADYTVDLEYQVEGAPTWTTVSLASGAAKATINNLNSDSTYLFRIRNRRLSDGGYSNWETLTSGAFLPNVHDKNLVESQNLSAYAEWAYDGTGMRLTAIRCPNRNLTGTLDLSGCTALKEVIVNNNKLTSINLSGCTSLTTLNCSENKITSLNVTGVNALQSLKCFGNELTFATLPVKTAALTEYVYVSGSRGQAAIPIAGGVIASANFDVLKPQAAAAGGVTTYKWYYENGGAVEAGLVTDDGKGVFTFSNSLLGLNVYCSMTNTEFTGLTLTTVPAKIGEVVGTPTDFKAVQNGNNIQLTWTAAANAAEYRICRWDAAAGKWVDMPQRVTGTAYTDPNVPAGEQRYLLRAYNGTAYGNSVTVTVGTPAVSVGTPSDFKAVQSGNDVQLTWTAATNAKEYRICRWDAAAGKWIDMPQRVTGTAYTDTNVPIGEQRYLLRAYNGTVYGNSVTVTLGTTVSVGVPSNFKAVQNGKNVQLSWVAAMNAAEYRICRWDAAAGKWVDMPQRVTGTAYTDTNVPATGELRYLLRAYNGTAYGNSVTVTVGTAVSVGKPLNFKAVLSGKNVQLSWAAATNAKEYRICRWDDAAGKWVDMPQRVTGTTYTEMSVPAGSQRYLLRAYNGTAYGDSVTVTINVPSASLAPSLNSFLNPLEAVFADFDVFDA